MIITPQLKMPQWKFRQKKASSENSQNIQNECNNMSQSIRDNPIPHSSERTKGCLFGINIIQLEVIHCQCSVRGM